MLNVSGKEHVDNSNVNPPDNGCMDATPEKGIKGQSANKDLSVDSPANVNNTTVTSIVPTRKKLSTTDHLGTFSHDKLKWLQRNHVKLVCLAEI